MVFRIYLHVTNTRLISSRRLSDYFRALSGLDVDSLANESKPKAQRRCVDPIEDGNDKKVGMMKKT